MNLNITLFSTHTALHKERDFKEIKCNSIKPRLNTHTLPTFD